MEELKPITRDSKFYLPSNNKGSEFNNTPGYLRKKNYYLLKGILQKPNQYGDLFLFDVGLASDLKISKYHFLDNPINLKYPTSYEDFIQSDGSYAQIIQIDEGVNYHFDFNQIYISNAQLEYIIETIRPFYDENKAISLTLEGHTDSIGSVEINERVGVMRASQVLYALENAGIEDADLKIISRGELDPIGSNSKPEGRAMNRRVEILYELQEDKLSK